MAEHLVLFMDGIDALLRRLPDDAARCPATCSPSRRHACSDGARTSRLRRRPTSGACASSAAVRSRSRRTSAGSSIGIGYLRRLAARTTAIQSVRSSLHSARITCIDAAILTYGLLELLFTDVKRRLLAIHRRDPATGEECGHCVALYWNDARQDRRVQQVELRRARPPRRRLRRRARDRRELRRGLPEDGLRAALLRRHHARGGRAATSTGASSPATLNVLSERIQDRYEYAFMLAR